MLYHFITNGARTAGGIQINKCGKITFHAYFFRLVQQVKHETQQIQT